MIDKKTVFILGAGASCPYGYPSGSHLRKRICLFNGQVKPKELVEAVNSDTNLNEFIKKFENSSTKSIDLFMARNPTLVNAGKHIVAYEIFDAEIRSEFREQAE